MPKFDPNKHYYGKPCKHGHGRLRYINRGVCVECACERARLRRERNPELVRKELRDSYARDPEPFRERARLWRQENPDRKRELDRRYYVANKARIIAVDSEWRSRNLESVREYNRKYDQRNPDKRRERLARRRARKAKATPAWIDHEEVKYIYSLATEKGLVVDHIVPLKSETVCGLHCAENLRCIPEQLNSHKGNRYWPDMPKDPV